MFAFKSIKLVPKVSAPKTNIINISKKFNSTTGTSICPAGTLLNLKIKNKQEEPVALEDSEYPDWLWTITEEVKLKPGMTAEEELKARKVIINHERRTQIKKTNSLLKKK